MKPSLSIFFKFILGVLLGSALALSFAIPYFSDDALTALDKFSLFAVPAFSLASLAYLLLSRIEARLGQMPLPEKLTALALASLAAGISTAALRPQSALAASANFVSLAAAFFALIFPAAPFFQIWKSPRLFLGWALAAAASFFVVGFLSNFYAELYLVALLSAVSLLAFGAVFYHALGRAWNFAQKDAAGFAVVFALFALGFGFQAVIFRMGAAFPTLFHADTFLPVGGELVVFAVSTLVLLPWLARFIQWLQGRRFPATWARENLPGLMLSALFFGLYLLIGSVLNHPSFDVDDIFFDSDGFIWRYRLTTDHWQDFYWRSVHPLALLILRPGVTLLSILLRGDAHFAAVMLTALAGAACVFLAWAFMKEIFRSAVPPLLMAFLLGASTSHLIFGSLIETYIFLAAAALLFFVLLQREKRSLPLLVAVGAVSMGITLTNFAQTVIALFGTKPDIKAAIRYVWITVALTVSLTLASNLFYPDASPYFFVPSSFGAEEQNLRGVSLNRAQALTRAFLFNNIAAPQPMLSQKDIPFTQFRFYRAEDYRISPYATPLQSAVAWLWLGLLALAAFFFVKDFKSHPLGLTLSLLGCVAFNLAIHLRYGKELFLYSPNWTYAVVLLLGISWSGLLARKWFQVVLLAFLVLLVWNNAALLQTIMEVSEPYVR